jgi:hypothetical protein
VTMPEELPMNESIELYAALRSELQLPVCGLVLNMVLPTLFDPAHAKALAELHARPSGDTALAQLVRASWTRLSREQLQAECRQRLRHEIPVPSYELPTLFTPDFRRAAIETLSHALTDTRTA